VVVAAVCTAAPPYANGPPIRSDGLGYHVWTRAILDWDFTFCRWVRDAGREQFSAIEAVPGRCQVKYPPGLALLQLPVMAFFVRRGPGSPFVSAGEHEATIVLGALALAVAVALLTDAARRIGASPWATSLAVATGSFGTGLMHYATYDASFTHVYSALGCSLLLWLGVRSSRSKRPLPIAAVALAAFFLVLLRSTNVLLVVGAAAAAAVALRPDGAPLASRASLVRAARNVAPIGMGAVVALLVQVAYNRYATGRLELSSYGTETFHLAAPRQLAVLASYERGLFTWYPWMAVALAASLLSRRVRKWALALAGLIGAYVVLYGFWWIWCLGGGFGHRGFVELVPAAILCFAAAAGELRKAARFAVGGAAIVAAFACVELMAGYWRGTIPFSGSTSRMYWAHLLGKSSLLPFAILDVDPGPPAARPACP
jgi:hypothetical protein